MPRRKTSKTLVESGKTSGKAFQKSLQIEAEYGIPDGEVKA
jgi:hypothetical protein